jgi:pyrimidine operon attenuation protein/uracil phosphoribosyltransferase
MNKKYILTAEKAHMKLRRIAFQILERNTQLQSIHIAGIKENGFLLALELKKILEEISSFQIELSAIELDKLNPIECKIDPTVDFKNKHVLIVDDVVNSGKAMLHAIHPLWPCLPTTSKLQRWLKEVIKPILCMLIMWESHWLLHWKTIFQSYSKMEYCRVLI